MQNISMLESVRPVLSVRDCSLKYVQLMLILISNISKEVFKRIFVSNAIKYAEKHEIVIS